MASLPRRLVVSVGQSLGLIRGVRCLVCGNTSDAFLATGPKQRPHARCRYCESNERHRLLWVLLHDRTELFTSDGVKLLYFAPEYFIEQRLRETANVDVTTVDLLRADVDVQADITDLPFPDGEYDAIICNHVLEHVPDDAQAMRELRRVIKPQGWAVISVPLAPGRATTFEDATITDPEQRARLFGQDDHLRIYGADFSDKLRAAGFNVSNVSSKQLKLGSPKRYGVPARYYLPFCTPR